MALFFFNITEGDNAIPDPEGIECSSMEAVQTAAFQGLSGLISEAVYKGERGYKGQVEVKDEYGAKVLTLVVSCPITVHVADPF